MSSYDEVLANKKRQKSISDFDQSIAALFPQIAYAARVMFLELKKQGFAHDEAVDLCRESMRWMMPRAKS